MNGGDDMSDEVVMSKHLLPVRFGTDDIPVTYKLFNQGGFTPQSVVSTCAHQVIYIGYSKVSDQFGLSKYNTITDTMTPIGTISWNDIGQRYAGGLLVDEKYFYVSATNLAVIRVFNQSDLSLVGVYQYSSSVFQGDGKIVWYDDHTICAGYDKGYLLFDTNDFSYTYKSQTNSYTRTDIAVGSRLVVSNVYNNQNVLVLRKDDDIEPFIVIQRSSTGRGVVCYENGLFYFIDNTGVEIYDEVTETFYPDRIVGLWGTSMNPRSACVYNGNLFITFCDSNRVYVMDTKSPSPVYQRYMLSQFTIPTWNGQRAFIPSISKNIFYNSYTVMMMMDFSGEYKYNCGYKYDDFSILYNSNNESDFEYDPRYITFTDSYMTMTDYIMILTIEDYNVRNSIKKISINKNDYGLIKSLNIITGEEESNNGDPEI